MNEREKTRSSLRDFIKKIVVLAAFIGIVFVCWQAAEVAFLIFAGFLLAILLRAGGTFISRRTAFSDQIGLIIVLIIIIGVIIFAVWFLSDSVNRQFDELTERLPAAYENMRGRLAQEPLGKYLIEKLPEPQQIVFGRQSANVFGRITGFFSSAFNAAVNVLIVLMTAIYLAFNPNSYREGIIKLIPKELDARAREVIYTIVFTLRRFLLGISVSMIVNGTLTALGLWFLGVPFAVPLGIIAGILTFIPNIGPVIAGAPAILIALSQSPWQALYVLALYLFVQNLDGFVITPLVQQKAIAVPPVATIAAQLTLALIFGFLGLLLAVPILAVIFVVVKMLYVEDVLDRQVAVKGEEEARQKT